ncbi:MAG: c-type cytochrome [Vicinamibacterales bacterium]|jgi:hypothetical protein|nr:c-type cytochrome [Vicinamibacterales bacterium]
MRRRTISVLACAVWLLATSVAAQSGYIMLGVPVPRGDAEAGRHAFGDLRCVTCHRLIAEPDLTAPTSANLGPDLGGVQAAMSTSRLATSILVPSHTISREIDADHRQRMLDTGGSAMGDFTDVMTIRQLVDLIAFLQSLGDRP